VVIHVKDNGVGISPKYVNDIFNRFFRISAQNEDRGGFGLGLAICKSIVKKHGGEISVKSIVGIGTTFIIILPLANFIK
jgi:two-component system sensor histidine kinase ResE